MFRVIRHALKFLGKVDPKVKAPSLNQDTAEKVTLIECVGYIARIAPKAAMVALMLSPI